ncbi:YcnI family protein [Nocardia huaxiensis]|uniref:YcnI family protein n=1 Tax=Nocardia huaxiensis TaxID=2755382 RepID=A0A7D6ZXM7_9NOCA|nr:YcnI family protein [Nocardia huaxiensis]QLY31109.1 YcnI family protein [Nocardia huaxiensis]
MHISLSRALGTAAVAASLTLLGAGVASAHVTVDAPGAAQGKYTVLTFKVPNESDTASTTKLTVAVPNLKSVRTEPLPGWTAKIDRNEKGEATAVTWTADPGNAGIGQGQFQRFVLSLGPLPKQDTVSFNATQTYSDGKVVAWDQQENADGTEPEHPAPSLKLASANGSGDEHKVDGGETAAAHDTDDTARWLGGVGLALGALGTALGLGSLIRSRRA